jgi:Glucodextranase, domain N
MPTERQPDGDPPGAPGIEPRWTSSAQTGVGTAAPSASQVWLTVSHGILHEIYWPEDNRPCTRDMGFIFSDRSRRRRTMRFNDIPERRGSVNKGVTGVMDHK